MTNDKKGHICYARALRVAMESCGIKAVAMCNEKDGFVINGALITKQRVSNLRNGEDNMSKDLADAFAAYFGIEPIAFHMMGVDKRGGK